MLCEFPDACLVVCPWGPAIVQNTLTWAYYFFKMQTLTLDTYISLVDQCLSGGGTSVGEPSPLTCKKLRKNPSTQA